MMGVSQECRLDAVDRIRVAHRRNTIRSSSLKVEINISQTHHTPMPRYQKAHTDEQVVLFSLQARISRVVFRS